MVKLDKGQEEMVEKCITDMKSIADFLTGIAFMSPERDHIAESFQHKASNASQWLRHVINDSELLKEEK